MVVKVDRKLLPRFYKVKLIVGKKKQKKKNQTNHSEIIKGKIRQELLLRVSAVIRDLGTDRAYVV